MFQQLCKRCSDQADKYERLCGVRADLSTAPYQTKRGRYGTMCYVRDFEVILLVGLTELMAQISWIDSVTVSPPKDSILLASLSNPLATLGDGDEV